MLKLYPIFNAPPNATPRYEVLCRANEAEEREVKVGVLEFDIRLHDVDAFKPPAIEAAQGCHVLSVFFNNETFDGTEDFRDLDSKFKWFLEGVEVQLRRKVIFVGAPEDHWIEVPLDVRARYWTEAEVAAKTAR